MPQERDKQTEAAEQAALDLRAQMRAAREAITQAAARVLAPEPRSFADEDEGRPAN